MNKCSDNCTNCSENCTSSKPMSKLQMWCCLLLIAVIGCFFAFINGAKKQQTAAVQTGRFTYPCMGTVVDISFFDSPEINEKAAKAVYDELHKIELMCNIFNPASEISKLNASADKKPFVCSKELYDLLLKCKKAYELTHGTFDITAKPLMNLWGFYAKQNHTPMQSEIEKTLAAVGLNKVRFDDNARSVTFTVKGMSFDLGGIAKGAAIDAALNAARNAGARNGIINLGGNIACFGKNRDGRDFFEAGIRDPLNSNAVIRKIRLADSCCATSGNYERFSVIDGKRYSHIMNPLTGYPVQNMYSATVVTAKGIDSDILSTACFILGNNFTTELVKKGILREAILIYPENNQINIKYITKEKQK